MPQGSPFRQRVVVFVQGSMPFLGGDCLACERFFCFLLPLLHVLFSRIDGSSSGRWSPYYVLNNPPVEPSLNERFHYSME